MPLTEGSSYVRYRNQRTRQLDVASHFHRFSFSSGHPLLFRSVHHTETITLQGILRISLCDLTVLGVLKV